MQHVLSAQLVPSEKSFERAGSSHFSPSEYPHIIGHDASTPATQEKTQLTSLNNFPTGSVVCAPTPSQYLVRAKSSCTSFCLFGANLVPSGKNSGVSRVASGVCGMGLYVPSTSIGFLPRADFAWARTILYIGRRFVPKRARRMRRTIVGV